MHAVTTAPDHVSAATLLSTPTGLPKSAQPCPPQRDFSASEHALTPLQLQALNLLLTGQTCTAIARRLSIGRRTLYNWRHHHSGFRAAFDAAATAILRRTATRAAALAPVALQTLEHQLRDPWQETSRRAAQTLLALSARARPSSS